MSDRNPGAPGDSPLKRALKAVKELTARIDQLQASQKEPIALVGMACRYPGGVGSADDYWKLLRDGVDAIEPVPLERWDADAYYDADPDAPGKSYVRHGGFLHDIDKFDPQFFGITPREALFMDPQHRLLLETSWHALEHAGIAPEKLAATQTAVFLGISLNDYSNLLTRYTPMDKYDLYWGTGSGFCMAAGRISYHLGLQGPNLALDTACSSSLVAVHLACQNLRNGACDVALAGGVNLILRPENFVYFSRTRALSRDGRCKSFDASGDGYGRGEGCGVVVLKRLSDALEDQDNIMAVIRGSAINHDGRSSALTVPNGQAQLAVLRAALADAGLEPEGLSYIEAHGTGTPLGDPIEMRALGTALCQNRSRENPLFVGSAKTNIGHLEGAAGVAGLMKAALALQHRVIPAHLHFENPNPHISWDTLPVRIPTETTGWDTGSDQLIAGVSSFGFSGTNAHIVLESAPELPDPGAAPERPLQLVTLSARNEQSLMELSHTFRKQVFDREDLPLADIAHTANSGRNDFEHRTAFLAASHKEAADSLHAAILGQTSASVFTGAKEGEIRPKMAFLFTGQGSQYAGMGRMLYETSSVFRQILDNCDKILKDYLPESLLSVLFSPKSKDLIDQTLYTQPALFAIEYALFEIWRSWGITPSVVMGHSVGEYVAACAAGIFSMEDGLRLLVKRAQLMQNLQHDGAMAAVFAGIDVVAEAIASQTDCLSIAAVNGPANVVISGEKTALLKILAQLEKKSIKNQQLTVSHAFHSPLMEPMLPEFEGIAAQVTCETPRIPMVSNITGAVFGKNEVPDDAYWRKHVREPVQFQQSIKTMHQRGCNIFLEVGPNPTLLGMAMRCLDAADALWLPSLRKNKEDWRQILESTAKLYVHGVDLDWHRFAGEDAQRRVVLPGYPFKRDRHWYDFNKAAEEIANETAATQTFNETEQSIVGRRLSSAALQDIVFERHLDLKSSMLRERFGVSQALALPRHFYVELAFAAAEQVWPETPVELRNVKLLSTLVVVETEAQVLQVVLTPNKKQFTLRVYSRSAHSEDAWNLRAEALLVSRKKTSDTQSGSVPPLDELLKRSKTSGSPNSDRPEHSSQEPAFADLQLAGGETLSRVSVKNGKEPGGSQLILHLLLTQVEHLTSLSPSKELAADVDAKDQQVIGMKSFWLAADYKQTAWLHARETEIRLMDETGELLGQIKGVHLDVLEQDARNQVRLAEVRRWLYEVQWQPIVGHNEKVDKGDWLVFADQSGVAARMVDKLLAAGIRCHEVYAARGDGNGTGSHTVIDPGDAQAFSDFIEKKIKQSGGQIGGILYLWGLDSADSSEKKPSADSAQADAETFCTGLLHLVQTLLASAIAMVTPLWLITRGAQSVSRTETTLSPVQAALWGLMRSLRLEHPELSCNCLDLDPQEKSIDTELLLNSLSTKTAENQMAVRTDKLYVPRLMPLHAASNGTQRKISISSEASYLITGGLGALGLRVAQQLVDRGARSLILMSRRTPSDEAKAAIDAMRRTGAKVVVARGDVAEKKAVTDMLTKVPEAFPLKGIVHAAGVLDDGLIEQLDAQRLAKVLLPKVRGTWNLFLQSQHLELDFFTCFSSAASVLGSPGQSNYAAANAFLDTFAYYHALNGGHATSVNWGPWAEIGMAAPLQNSEATRASASGLRWIQPEDGLLLFNELDALRPIQAVVLPMDWYVFKSRLQGTPQPFYDEIMDGLGTNGAETARVESAGLRERLSAGSRSDQEEILLNYVKEAAGMVMGIAINDKRELRKPLQELGMDSLMAVELRNALASGSGLELPATLLFEYPNVEAISNYLSAELLHPRSAKEEAREGADEDEDKKMNEIRDLTEEEIQTSIAEELKHLTK